MVKLARDTLDFLRVKQTISLAGTAWRKSQAAEKVAYRPIFGKDKRRHIVMQMMDLLADWRLSPFENEATCRQGLRSALCLDGHSWQRADDEAASIIGECLKGAQRPSYDEGQRSWSTPAESCRHCSSPLDDHQIGRGIRFCSAHCAKAATLWRDDESARFAGKIGKQAFYLIRKDDIPARDCQRCDTTFKPSTYEAVYCSSTCARNARPDILDERECATCSKPFRPNNRSKAGLYCSPVCASTGRTTKPERPCDHCQRMFKPHRHSQNWCSVECRSAGQKATLSPRTCDHCGDMFQPGSPKALYCSAQCRNRAAHVKYLTKAKAA